MGQYKGRLRALADDEILAGLSSIVGRRNQITAEFLGYLAELDERQLFLDLGFASLFEYCVEALGLCESTAGRHIAAARVCRNHPEVFGLVESGALHASALSLLRRHLTPENAGKLFELCTRKSARKVEALLAARFPRPDVRDLVRRLPAQTGLTLDVESASQKVRTEPPSREPPRERSVETQKALVESPPRESPPRESPPRESPPRESPPREASAASKAAGVAKPRRFEPLSADRYGVHFTADSEFYELLERVRGLVGHRLPSGDLLTLLKRGLEAYERELTKERFALGRKPRRSRSVSSAPSASAEPAASDRSASAAPSAPAASDRSASAAPSASDRSASAASTAPSAPAASDRFASEPPNPELSTPDAPKSDAETTPNPNPNRKRHCPAAVARAVFMRDGQRCSYVSPDGRQCNARRCLELDHVNPWAMGGEDTLENLRLRCRAHN